MITPNSRRGFFKTLIAGVVGSKIPIPISTPSVVETGLHIRFTQTYDPLNDTFNSRMVSDYNDLFRSDYRKPKIGDTINVRRPMRFVSSEKGQV